MSDPCSWLQRRDKSPTYNMDYEIQEKQLFSVIFKIILLYFNLRFIVSSFLSYTMCYVSNAKNPQIGLAGPPTNLIYSTIMLICCVLTSFVLPISEDTIQYRRRGPHAVVQMVQWLIRPWLSLRLHLVPMTSYRSFVQETLILCLRFSNGRCTSIIIG